MAVLVRELCAEEGIDDLAGQRRSDNPRADAEHVHIVVLDGLMRGVSVVADGGADAWKFIGRNRHAGATSADDHAAVRVAIEDRLRHGFG